MSECIIHLDGVQLQKSRRNEERACTHILYSSVQHTYYPTTGCRLCRAAMQSIMHQHLWRATCALVAVKCILFAQCVVCKGRILFISFMAGCIAMLVARAVFQNRTQKNKAPTSTISSSRVAFPFYIKVVCEGFRSESCFSMTHTMLISLAGHKAAGARKMATRVRAHISECVCFSSSPRALLHLFHGQLGTLKTGHCSTFVWHNLSLNFSAPVVGCKNVPLLPHISPA